MPHSSPTPASTPKCFFKVMIGDFSDRLFIPPKFRHAIGDLVKQNVHLEDLHGHSWGIRLALSDGSLAFQQGWRDFVLDHSISEGEIVTFRYIGGLHFSAQIFGTSGCERVHFRDKNNSCPDKRKRSVTEIFHEDIHLQKTFKSCKASEDKLKAVNSNSMKKKQEFEAATCKSSGVRAAEVTPATKNINCTTEMKRNVTEICHEDIHLCKRVKNFKASEDKPKAFNASSVMRKPDLESVTCKSYGIRTAGKNPTTKGVKQVSFAEDVLRAKGSSRIPPVGSCGAESNIVGRDPSNPMAVESNFYPKEKERLVTREDWVADEGYGIAIPQLDPAIGHTNDNTKDPIDLSEHQKHASTQGVEIISGDGLLRSHSAQPKCSDDKGNLIERVLIDQKFFLTEDGICHIEDEYYLMNEPIAVVIPIHQITPIRSFPSATKDMAYQDVKAGSPKEASFQGQNINKAPSTKPIFDIVGDATKKDMPNNEKINKNSQQKGVALTAMSKKNNAIQGRSGCAPKSKTEIHKCLKEPCKVEGKTWHSGIKPDAFPREGNNKDTECLKGKSPMAIKSEIMDSIDRAPNSIHFRVSLPVDAQSWLKLPKRLSSCSGKLRNDRKVIMLRDPSMRLWPVLYHENSKFVGFICGWLEFLAGNNLQQGHHCDFEEDMESEGTIRVRISRS